MAKIPFDIKYRPQIESGEYKVETESGDPAIVMDWDWNNNGEKCFAIKISGQWKDSGLLYTYEGKRASIFPPEEGCDLFIITPEPELTEFEYAVANAIYPGCNVESMLEFNSVKQSVRDIATKLLSLAHEQFIKDGYVIEKKAFHEAVEKVDPEVMKEVSENVDMKEALRLEYEKGRVEALKEFEKKYKWAWFNEGKIAGRFEGVTEDEKYQLGVHDGKEVTLKNLPRWEKTSNKGTFIDASKVFHDGYYLRIKALEKLPGFKED